MRLDEIQELWSDDSQLDRNDLANQSLLYPKLHSKYYAIFLHEKMMMLQLKDEAVKLKFDKYEFYTQGPSSYTNEKGWEPPACGRVAKMEADRYMEADNDIIKLNQKLQFQVEKTKFVESIIGSLVQRGFAIKNAIEVIRFESGN